MTGRDEPTSAPGVTGALTSRLGRRFVLLFALGALLPLIAFAGLSVTRVQQQTRADLRVALHDAAKSSGMSVAARLGQVAGDLRLAADLVRSRSAGAGWSDGDALAGQVQQHCDAVWLLGGDRAEVLFGEGEPPLTALVDAQRGHLARGMPLVLLEDDGLLMLLQLEAHERLVGRVRADWFWDPQELRGASCQFAACAPDGRVLYHTFAHPPSDELLAASVTRRDASGSLEWQVDGEPHLGRYWHVFLRPQYGADLWVVQSRSQADALSVARSFERSFWLTAACALLCVVLVGLVTTRRTLDPIVSLRDASRRLGRGQLDARVDVATRDEVGELGAAFNEMASRLQENIARREQTERELVASRDAALAAAKAKAEFVTNVSHEFRTPMAEVLGAAEILTQLDDGVDRAAREEFSEIALHGARRLAKLIDEVLELSDTSSAEHCALDVCATLRAAIEEMPAEVRARIGCDLATGLPPVWGDRDALVATWRRLLDNAAKFSAPDAQILVEAELVRGAVEVRVVDHGVGIAAADLEAVFEPFAQVGRDQLVEKAEGTGLGLSLAKAAVETLGGEIAASSGPAPGATFTVRLPVASGA